MGTGVGVIRPGRSIRVRHGSTWQLKDLGREGGERPTKMKRQNPELDGYKHPVCCTDRTNNKYH